MENETLSSEVHRNHAQLEDLVQQIRRLEEERQQVFSHTHTLTHSLSFFTLSFLTSPPLPLLLHPCFFSASSLSLSLFPLPLPLSHTSFHACLLFPFLMPPVSFGVQDKKDSSMAKEANDIVMAQLLAQRRLVRALTEKLESASLVLSPFI